MTAASLTGDGSIRSGSPIDTGTIAALHDPKATTVASPILDPLKQPSSPATSLSSHTAKRTTVQDLIVQVNKTQKKDTAAYKAGEREVGRLTKAMTSLKTSKVFGAIIGIIGVAFIATAIGALCTFCPPLGILAIAGCITLGMGGGTALYMYGVGKYFDSSFGQDLQQTMLGTVSTKMEAIRPRLDNLNECLNLFKEHPKKKDLSAGEVDKSFEGFVEQFQPADPKAAHTYTLDNLFKYKNLFKRKLELEDQEKQLEAIRPHVKQMKEEASFIEDATNFFTADPPKPLPDDIRKALDSKIDSLEKQIEGPSKDSPHKNSLIGLKLLLRKLQNADEGIKTWLEQIKKATPETAPEFIVMCHQEKLQLLKSDLEGPEGINNTTTILNNYLKEITKNAEELEKQVGEAGAQLAAAIQAALDEVKGKPKHNPTLPTISALPQPVDSTSSSTHPTPTLTPQQLSAATAKRLGLAKVDKDDDDGSTGGSDSLIYV